MSGDEEGEESHDEPPHPAVRQPEHGEGERGFAEEHGEDRGGSRNASQDAHHKVVVEGDLVDPQTESETNVGHRRGEAEEEKGLFEFREWV